MLYNMCKVYNMRYVYIYVYIERDTHSIHMSLLIGELVVNSEQSRLCFTNYIYVQKERL